MPLYTPPGSPDADARRQRYITLGMVVAALILSYLPTGGQETIASGLRSTILRPLLGFQGVVLAARQRTLDVQVLQARLDSATASIVERSTLEEENDRLRALLELKDRLGANWRAGEVLRPGTEGAESTFLLNLGADDGVPPMAPVLTLEGLAGVVREVREGSSIGMDWTNPDFRASGMSDDGAVYGFLETRRGLFREEDRLLLTSTPYAIELAPGTEIVTSGRGGVFPRGIPIGRVVEVAESEGGWNTSYWVEPFVTPGDMAQVVVMLGAGDSIQAGTPVGGREGVSPTGAAVPTAPGDSTAMLAAGDSAAVVQVLDLTEVWPEGTRGTRAERRAREQARADSLLRLERRVLALEDSLARLEARRDRGGGLR